MVSFTKKSPVALVIILAIFLSIISTAPAMAEDIPNKGVAKEVFQKMRGLGATPEVSAAIIGNAAQESSVNPSALQSSAVREFIKKGDLCKKLGIGGAAAGMFQWDSARRDAMLCYSQKNDLKWDSVDNQLKYAFVAEIKNEDPFKNSAYGKKAKSTYCPGSGADCSKIRTKLKGVSEYFKGDDVGAATIEFTGYWERPGSPKSSRRVKIAKQAYKEFKDLPPVDIGESVSNGDNGNKDKGENKGNNGGKVDEDDLTGMPDKHEWDKGNPPKDAKYEDLDTVDQYNVTALRDDINMQQSGSVHVAQITVSLIGMLVMLWCILLFAGMLVDKANPFFEFQCTRFLTLGRMEYVEDPQDKGKGRYMGRQITQRCGVGILLGLILVSGTFFGWTLQAILFLQNQLGG